MKQLPGPSSIFAKSLPMYQEAIKIINKIKSSGSPCPHDHMSIIMLKLCLFLRTAWHRIISQSWEKQTFPKTWKYAFIILIYKKGEKKVPSNFRPITSQPAFAKVYSSLISNRIYKFLLENNCIESKIQKRVLEWYICCYWAYWIINYTINHTRKK